MSKIRPLERADIPQVASLYERIERSGKGEAPLGLGRHFERTFHDHPWADPEIPSLVYEDANGAIKGFVGSHVRHLRFGHESIRLACPGQLVADFDVRKRAAGFFLLRQYLNGEQDVTITDTAGEPTRRMWEGLGGRVVHHNCVEWFRLFRPWRIVGDRMLKRAELPRLREIAAAVWPALDSVTTRLGRRFFRPAASRLEAEELTPGSLVAATRLLGGGWRVYPAYDEQFSEWLLEEAASVRSYGTLIGRLVRDANGRTAGWYLYYAKEGELGHVLQVVAKRQDMGAVVDHLYRDAFERGVAALRGRLEARLFDTLAERRVLLRRSEMGITLVHSRNQELENAVLSGDTLLSRLDGEWWAGFHLEGYGEDGQGGRGID
jgi:hypothetical protein